jgi:uncharacterized protein
MKYAVLVSLTLVAAAVAGWMPPRGAHGGPAMKPTFLALYRPGPQWAAGKPIREQPPKEHGKYLLDLYARGVMKFAGPFDDNTGAAVVVEAADEAEARALIAADPAVKNGVFAAEIHPWALVPWEKYLKKNVRARDDRAPRRPRRRARRAERSDDRRIPAARSARSHAHAARRSRRGSPPARWRRERSQPS